MSLPEQREKPAILNDVWRRLRGRLSGHHSTLSSTAFGDTRPRDYVLSAPLQPSACHANCDFSCPTTRQTHSLFSPLLSPLFLHFFFPSFPSLPLSLSFFCCCCFLSFLSLFRINDTIANRSYLVKLRRDGSRKLFLRLDSIFRNFRKLVEFRWETLYEKRGDKSDTSSSFLEIIFSFLFNSA